MATIQVSPFELLIKAIAPIPAGSPLEQVNRTVIQGYFLTISNLVDLERQISFSFVISAPSIPPDNTPTSRTLEGNTVLLYDIAGANQELTFNLISTPGTPYLRYNSVGSIKLPNLASVTVQLLPKAELVLTSPDTKLEIRGFCEVIADDGVTGDVFLNPEIRGTFIPNQFRSIIPGNPIGDIQSRLLDFDQLSYSLGVQRQTI
ncbi:hypothetical protein [Gloeocapsa sp. PCC 73106]|uniref:hypothetical protein n=1 Tax=Gloeocapsa sp. PCC 73106 TaxID=102232 RepID=UPI0002AC9E5E|nr:hypothetical protein [Gloeocapsa sp. PCC 73106]ELR98174.1 hypothetical protein GLO73106DRAFT_00020010 [Gloeocapsa sp. PCC 73106]